MIVVFLAGTRRLQGSEGAGHTWHASFETALLVEHAAKLCMNEPRSDEIILLGTEGELLSAKAILRTFDIDCRVTSVTAENTFTSVEAVCALLQEKTEPEQGAFPRMLIVAMPHHVLRCAMLLRSRGIDTGHERIRPAPLAFPILRLFLPGDDAPRQLSGVVYEIASIASYIASGKIRGHRLFGLLPR